MDSVKRDYPRYVDRIHSIRFISDYLKKNADARLDISRADFGVTGYGLTYSCALFDLEGNRITK